MDPSYNPRIPESTAGWPFETFALLPVAAPKGKEGIGLTNTGDTPPTTPKHPSDNKTNQVAEKIIPKAAEAASSAPITDHKVEPLLAYKDEADTFKKSIQNLASRIIGVVVFPFIAIGTFFARLGGAVKGIFIKQPVAKLDTITKVVQQHLTDVAVHLADIKAIGHFPGFVKKVIKSFLRGIILDETVLPTVFNKAKALLQEKFFDAGKAGPMISKLMTNLVVKFGEDFAAIAQYNEGNSQNQKEGNIIGGLAAHAKTNMSDLELDDFSERYKTLPIAQKYKHLQGYITQKKKLRDLELKLDKNNSSTDTTATKQANKKVIEKDIKDLKIAMYSGHEEIEKLLKDVQQSHDNPKTPIFEKQQLGRDIATLNGLYDFSSYPKTHKGVLHNALYAINADELDILSQRYDIIRIHYPNLQKLEDLESKLRKINELENKLNTKRKSLELLASKVEADKIVKPKLDRQIKSLEDNSIESIESSPEYGTYLTLQKSRGLIDAREDKYLRDIKELIKLADELQVLTGKNALLREAVLQVKAELSEQIFKVREAVNQDNYSTEAVLAHVQKIVPKDALLNSQIQALKDIIEIETKTYKQEQVYIRRISLKVFDFVYPNGLPLKFTLPLQILNQNAKDVVLKLLDMMIFNAIDTVSDPSFVLGSANDLLKAFNLSQAVNDNTQSPATPSSVNKDLENLILEALRVGFPKLTTALIAGRAATEYAFSKGDQVSKYIPSVPSRIKSMMPKFAADAVQKTSEYVDEIRKWVVEKEYVKVVQAKIEEQQIALVHQLETSGNTLLDQGLAVVDGIMVPDGKLRAFRSGYTQTEMDHLKKEMTDNIGIAIKNIPMLNDFGRVGKKANEVAKEAARDYVERFSMQVVNKHLIYGILDQALAALEV